MPTTNKQNFALKIEMGTEQDRNYLDDKIVEFNSQAVAFTQKENFIHLDYVTKDDAGNVIGGITALSYCWKILYIDVLWVDKKHRHSGYGSQLLQRLEIEAKKLGCTLAHLDTFDFQAKDFYIKQGYEIFGELHDCPPDHSRFFLKKIL